MARECWGLARLVLCGTSVSAGCEAARMSCNCNHSCTKLRRLDFSPNPSLFLTEPTQRLRISYGWSQRGAASQTPIRAQAKETYRALEPLEPFLRSHSDRI